LNKVLVEFFAPELPELGDSGIPTVTTAHAQIHHGTGDDLVWFSLNAEDIKQLLQKKYLLYSCFLITVLAMVLLAMILTIRMRVQSQWTGPCHASGPICDFGPAAGAASPNKFRRSGAPEHVFLP
jgi:hypothetical protein